MPPIRWRPRSADTRDYAGAEPLYRLAISDDPNNATLLTNLASMYSQMGRHGAVDSLLAIVASSNTSFSTAPTHFLDLWNRRDYDGAQRLAHTIADTAKPRVAVDANDGLVAIDVTRGRLREAERRFAQVNEAKARVQGDTVSPQDVAFFHAMLDGQLRGDAPRGLAELDASLGTTSMTSVPLAKDESMVLAAGYGRLGAAAKARELMTQHEARLDTLGRNRDAVQLARLHGWIALAERKTDSAVAYFRRGDAEADGLPTSSCTVCTPLFIGLSFDRGGQADSARAYLTQYVEMNGNGHYFVDRFYLAPALFRLGELYESAGDAKHATEYYGRFIDLWANADSDLQPRVVEARKRIDRLNRATR